MNAALLAAIRVRLAAGDGPKAVAAALGVTRGVVAGMLRRHGRGEPPAAPGILHAPGPGLCSYPLNSGRPWRFCEAPRLHGYVYCAAHLRICVHGHTRLESVA